MSHARLLDYLRTQSQDYCSRHGKSCPAGLSPQLEARRDVLAADVVRAAAAGPQDAAEDALVHDNTAGVAVEVVQGSQVRSEVGVGQPHSFACGHGNPDISSFSTSARRAR